ncbi:MAPEG family protein (plasmid) [Aquicoccus sp. G2-2]|uniref:MAPEG family protein n=1 Tax=Aquicoccus sp. G2-2 TaxID=3092120 RepID=UPI002AE04C44|nr:MAPEG family protein [Aquicoccus sp. G2-2]MEA1111994.1 MAPEG family protein [Aquicoccus sp. G2-2]
MNAEILVLALSAGLGLLHIILASHSASFQRGYKWAAGARDEPLPPLSGIAGRLERASRNFFETFPVFVAAVVIVTIRAEESTVTAWASIVYLIARSAYLGAYVSGIYLLRSLIWNVATVAILIILTASFV